MSSLRKDCFAALCSSGGAIDMLNRNLVSADDFIDRMMNMVDWAIEKYPQDALNMCRIVSPHAVNFVRLPVSIIDPGKFFSQSITLIGEIDDQELELVGATQSTSQVASQSSSAAQSAPKVATSPANGRKKREKPAEEKKEKIDGTKSLPAEVGVSQLGLDQRLADLLYDAELGTTKQVLEFDELAVRGLTKIVNPEERKKILAAIAANTNQTVYV